MVHVLNDEAISDPSVIVLVRPGYGVDAPAGPDHFTNFNANKQDMSCDGGPRSMVTGARLIRLTDAGCSNTSH